MKQTLKTTFTMFQSICSVVLLLAVNFILCDARGAKPLIRGSSQPIRLNRPGKLTQHIPSLPVLIRWISLKLQPKVSEAENVRAAENDRCRASRRSSVRTVLFRYMKLQQPRAVQTRPEKKQKAKERDESSRKRIHCHQFNSSPEFPGWERKNLCFENNDPDWRHIFIISVFSSSALLLCRERHSE